MIGGTAEIGITLDFRKGFKIGGYATLGHAVGGDLSAGLILDYYKPVSNSNNFSASDLKGWGESYNGGLWFFDGTFGGDAINQGINPNNYSDSHTIFNSYDFGVSIGTPFGFTRNKEYTWTTPTIGW